MRTYLSLLAFAVITAAAAQVPNQPPRGLLVDPAPTIERHRTAPPPAALRPQRTERDRWWPKLKPKPRPVPAGLRAEWMD